MPSHNLPTVNYETLLNLSDEYYWGTLATLVLFDIEGSLESAQTAAAHIGLYSLVEYASGVYLARKGVFCDQRAMILQLLSDYDRSAFESVTTILDRVTTFAWDTSSSLLPDVLQALHTALDVTISISPRSMVSQDRHAREVTAVTAALGLPSKLQARMSDFEEAQ